jgi:hypothetical protein
MNFAMRMSAMLAYLLLRPLTRKQAGDYKSPPNEADELDYEHGHRSTGTAPCDLAFCSARVERGRDVGKFLAQVQRPTRRLTTLLSGWVPG